MANKSARYLVVALVGIACGRPDPLSKLAVVGPGTSPVSDGAWENTVALTDRGRLACSGVLVTPTVVLTAAHCLPPGTDVTTLKVYRGAGQDGGRFSGSLAVVRGARHPDYPSSVWGMSDLAYLVLAEPQLDVALIPAAATVAEVDELLQPSSRLRLVGYGVRDNATRALGLKTEGDGALKFHSARELVLGDQEGDACDGDSGGPAFGRLPDASFRLLGITSRGPPSCGNASYPGVWTLIAPYACWLEAETGWDSGAGCGARVDPPAAASSLCSAERGDDGARRTVAALRNAFIAADGRRRRAAEVDCVELQIWAESVQSLDLSRSLLVDASPLAVLRSVERLDLEDNALTDIEPLRALGNLRLLRIGWNALASTDSMEGFVAAGVRVTGAPLQAPSWRLDRRSSFVRQCLAAQSGGDQGALATMNALRRAACFGTECSCYSANDELQRARSLDLANAAVGELSALAGFSNLQYLDLSGVSATDLAPLAAFENLRTLRLTRAPGSLEPLAPILALGDLAILE